MKSLQHYIDGRWVAPVVTGERFPVIDPATESQVAEICMGSAADVDLAVAAASRAFPGFAATPLDARLDALRRINEVFKRRFDEMADAITTEMGAPRDMAREAQAASGPGHIEATIKAAQLLDWEVRIDGSNVVREPIGVCGLVTPWNWPINQILAKVAPAIAAGCTMVLKPSEQAPLSAQLIAEFIDEAGLPPGVFNLVHGNGPTVGHAMSAHPDIEMMSFTGSTRAGIDVAQRSAPTVKRVSQELGGKSPNIILDDADFQKAVSGGVAHVFLNAGQSCNAPTRMLVPQLRMDEVMAIAKAVADKTKAGDPRADDTQMGPVVNETQWHKIQGLIAKGIEEGATLVAGGPGRPEGHSAGYLVRPTIFGNVRNDMTIAREEVFGPVLVIIGYADDEDAVRMANDTPYGLAGYVSGGNKDRVRAVARRLRAGNINLNGVPNERTAPFGGYKQSGNGREWGRFGLEEYLEVKAIAGFN